MQATNHRPPWMSSFVVSSLCGRFQTHFIQLVSMRLHMNLEPPDGRSEAASALILQLFPLGPGCLFQVNGQRLSWERISEDEKDLKQFGQWETLINDSVHQSWMYCFHLFCTSGNLDKRAFRKTECSFFFFVFIWWHRARPRNHFMVSATSI